jgi:hypothetical protein
LLEQEIVVAARLDFAAKRELIFTNLAELPARGRITVLTLPCCNPASNPEDAQRLVQVLAQYPALSHLDLQRNYIRDKGAFFLAAVLPHCRNLKSLYLNCNEVGDEGTGWLARVLSQCPALSELDLSNEIGAEGAGMLRAAWSQHIYDLHLDDDDFYED